MNKDSKAYTNKIKYIHDYNKSNYKTYCLKFHKEFDRELIELLESVPNKQGLIKKALLELKKSGN